MRETGDALHNLFFPMSKAKVDPTHCHCGKVALYRVGTNGYCSAHRSKADEAQAAVIAAREIGASEKELWRNAKERLLRGKVPVSRCRA